MPPGATANKQKKRYGQWTTRPNGTKPAPPGYCTICTMLDLSNTKTYVQTSEKEYVWAILATPLRIWPPSWSIVTQHKKFRVIPVKIVPLQGSIPLHPEKHSIFMQRQREVEQIITSNLYTKGYNNRLEIRHTHHPQSANMDSARNL